MLKVDMFHIDITLGLVQGSVDGILIFKSPSFLCSLVTEQNRRHICVDASLLWVKNMMRHLDEKDLK